MNLKHVKTTKSTQDDVENNKDLLNNRNGYYTFDQTNGRGRLNSKWEDNKSTIAFSFIVRENTNNTIPLSLIVATNLLKLIGDINVKIKWPNDLYLKNKKICGILVERKFVEKKYYSIIGVGINICPTEYAYINITNDDAVDIAQKLSNSDFSYFDKGYFLNHNFYNDYDLIINDVRYAFSILENDGSLGLINKDGGKKVLFENVKIDKIIRKK